MEALADELSNLEGIVEDCCTRERFAWYVSKILSMRGHVPGFDSVECSCSFDSKESLGVHDFAIDPLLIQKCFCIVEEAR
jgi:hypothetical protein